MSIELKIRAALSEPEELEQLYRNNPKSFIKAYRNAFDSDQNSILFRAWQARLEFTAAKTESLSTRDIMVMLLLCFCSGTILKIPDWTHTHNIERFAWMISLIPLTAMFLFTMHMRGWPRKITGYGICCNVITAAVMQITPVEWEDVYTLANFNLPLFIWCLYGFSRTGLADGYKHKRIEFLRFSGEMVIHSGLLFLGGGILLLLTYGLFDLLNIRNDWIIEDLAVYGLASIPLVAAWATDTYSAARKMVPLLARIFSPLLLVLILCYMGAMAWNMPELFKDRSTLLTYNILLLCVLCCAIFTMTGNGERTPGKMETKIISTMIAATVLLDLIGIWAISWRICEYGITANRISVLGSNIVVFGNLVFMGMGCIRHHFGSGSQDDIEDSLAAYLPAYAVWTGFSVIILPWIFRY
ncbi:hypothetical protein [Maridesulfovibrio sp.]|uniref:hypothetical protein n=1 Tax=Maridesulfovibrio sp. TaxID=2795000 RepID=UPI0039EFD407